jgi:predicted MFS family arabinose efflux permease
MENTVETGSKQTIWTRGFICAFAAQVLLAFSQHTVNTLISTYAAFLGAGAVLVGTISGLYFAVAFAARPISGPAITVLDRRKLLLWIFAAGVVTNLVYACARSVPIFILARVLHGLQFAFVGSLNLTIASDSVPKERLGSAIGMFGIGSALSTALGPGLGVLVRDWATGRWDEAAGYTALFLMAALFMLLAIIPCALMPKPEKRTDMRNAWKYWYRNIVSKETVLPAVLMCLNSISSMTYTTYMVPFGAARGISSIALFFTVYAVVMLAGRPLFGKLSDRVSLDKVLIPGLFLFAVSFVMVARSRTLPALLAAAVVAALGMSATNPLIQTLCIRSVEPHRRGVASNTEYFGMDLGFFLGPFLGGLIYARSDYPRMFLAMGLIPQALSLVLFLAIWRRMKDRLY